MRPRACLASARLRRPRPPAHIPGRLTGAPHAALKLKHRRDTRRGSGSGRAHSGQSHLLSGFGVSVRRCLRKGRLGRCLLGCSARDLGAGGSGRKSRRGTRRPGRRSRAAALDSVLALGVALPGSGVAWRAAAPLPRTLQHQGAGAGLKGSEAASQACRASTGGDRGRGGCCAAAPRRQRQHRHEHARQAVVRLRMRARAS